MNSLRLGDVTEKIGSGATPRGGEQVYRDAGVALIRSQNVYNDGFSRDGLAFIGDGHAEELSHVEVKAGDVLLNITGDSVARVCQAPEDMLPARVNQHVAIIRPRQDLLDACFLRYFLASPIMQQHMLALASAGGTRSALTKGMIENFRVPAFPVAEQLAIAHTLGSLDDKIELNRRMNGTLEAMARAIFKSWFVDFDPVRAKAERRQPFGMEAATAALFPDSFEDSPLGKIPKSWQIAKLDSICELAYGKALRQEIREVGPVPVYGSNGQVGWHIQALVKGPGVVVGRKGNPGFITWVSGDFFPIDTTFYVVSRFPFGGMRYLFHQLSLLDLPSLAADSAVPGLNRNIAYMTKVLVPTQDFIEAFERSVNPVWLRVNESERESNILAALRDGLLPKLISGDVRVKDVEEVSCQNVEH